MEHDIELAEARVKAWDEASVAPKENDLESSRGSCSRGSHKKAGIMALFENNAPSERSKEQAHSAIHDLQGVPKNPPLLKTTLKKESIPQNVNSYVANLPPAPNPPNGGLPDCSYSVPVVSSSTNERGYFIPADFGYTTPRPE